ncbi:MAG: NAD-dependent epimerase/dehydratase family protein [Candidatus Uhrbacteria bacterium]|nr:NAD-dependent epimerase/dehydratase family protein [Candidatus Uhrbacteria bacterium]
MKYIVTGGAGFIGSTLAKRMIRDGHEVVIIDNFSTGLRERVPEGATVVEWDLTSEDIQTLASHMQGADGVFHFAALPRVPFSIAEPIISSKHNVFGTLHTLVAARDAGVRRVVYSASSSAYGNQPVLPQHPDMKPQPLSPYALQKLMGEHFCSQFYALYGLETVSLRYFNVYGPGMAEDGAYAPVFAIFKRQYLAKEPLTICGDGSQTRSFCHVDDVVEANVKAMMSEKAGKGEVLNVSGPTSVSIKDIADRFNHPITYLDPRPGDVPHSLGDIERTKELIDWEPKIHFDHGFEALLKHWGVR